MNHLNAFLEMKLSGPDIGPGRVRLDDFIRLSIELQRAVETRGPRASGGARTVHRAGRRPLDLRAAISLDLVEVTHGSPTAVVRFERTQSQLLIPGTDVGTVAFERFLDGLNEVASASEGMPSDMTPASC